MALKLKGKRGREVKEADSRSFHGGLGKRGSESGGRIGSLLHNCICIGFCSDAVLQNVTYHAIYQWIVINQAGKAEGFFF